MGSDSVTNTRICPQTSPQLWRLQPLTTTTTNTRWKFGHMIKSKGPAKSERTNHFVKHLTQMRLRTSPVTSFRQNDTSLDTRSVWNYFTFVTHAPKPRVHL